MDLKGTLLDTEIKIIPSPKLITYLKTLKDVDLPENIAKIVNGKYKIIDAKENQDELSKPIPNLELSDREKEVLKKIKETVNQIKTESSNKDEESAESVNQNIYLKVTDLDWLYLTMNERRKNDDDVPYLHELLCESKIVLPSNEIIKRNPELEARCVKLRARQEAREYRAMTRGVDNVRMQYPEDTISYQLKHLNRQLIAIGQFIISLFAGFLFGFLGIELLVGQLDFGFRLLLGVMCALVIALAEIYFLAKKLNEELTMPQPEQLGGPPRFTHLPTPSQTVTKASKELKKHQD